MSDVVERAKAALEGVTEGPWEVNPHTTPGYMPHYGVKADWRTVVFAQTDFEGYGNGSSKADAEFIAAARSLIPELVAEIERLRAAAAPESPSPVPASPNPPDTQTSAHSPHSGQEPTPQHDDKAGR